MALRHVVLGEDDTLLERVELEPELAELAELQIAFRDAMEPTHMNPWYAQSLAHRFGRLVRERAERLLVV